MPTSAHARRSPEQPQGYLLDLQRRFGNAAVAALVQRAPRDRPASTDAPGRGPKRRGKPSKPAPSKPAADIHARVIKYVTDQGMGLITIASGPDQGVKVGMSGSLLLANGTEYADFTIETGKGGMSSAHVQATQDQVSANPQVVIKASKFSNESQEGKAF